MADTERILSALRDHGAPEPVLAAVEAGRVGALIADRSRILAATDPYLAMTGFSRDELEAGQLSWLRLTPPEWLTADARAIGEANVGGRSRPYDKEYLRRDGSRVRIALALLLLTADPLTLGAVVVDAGDDEGRALLSSFGQPG